MWTGVLYAQSITPKVVAGVAVAASLGFPSHFQAQRAAIVNMTADKAPSFKAVEFTGLLHQVEVLGAVDR